MDHPTRSTASRATNAPIHRACVVRGCWCGSTAARGTVADPASSTTARLSTRIATAATDLTGIAWRTVGLPVV
jgi:hypothetical protein